MSGWRQRRLGDALAVKHGFAFKGEYFRATGTRVVLTPGNFHDAGGFKPKSGAEKFYEGPVPEGYVLAPGDVVVAMTEQARGLLGSTATIPSEGTYLHNQRIGLVQITDPAVLDRRFAYHLFNAPGVRAEIQATATGSKVRHTAPERIENIWVNLPGITDQRRIAAVLDAIDDLGANNQRRVDLLEEMARWICREWFVHFRYPGHEQDELMDSPLGPVPAGWEVVPVEEVASVVRGRSYRKSELVGSGGVPFINLKCLERGGGFRRDGLKRYAGKFKPEQVTRPGDIVIAVTDLTQGREILARATFVPRLRDEAGVISLDVARVVPKTGEDRIALFTALRYSDLADRVKELANGSTVLHLSPNHVASPDHSLADGG